MMYDNIDNIVIYQLVSLSLAPSPEQRSLAITSKISGWRLSLMGDRN